MCCWRSLDCLLFRRSSVLCRFADLFPADHECPSSCCTALELVPVSTTDRALRLLRPMLPPIRRIPPLKARPCLQAAPNCVPRTHGGCLQDFLAFWPRALRDRHQITETGQTAGRCRHCAARACPARGPKPWSCMRCRCVLRRVRRALASCSTPTSLHSWRSCKTCVWPIAAPCRSLRGAFSTLLWICGWQALMAASERGL